MLATLEAHSASLLTLLCPDLDAANECTHHFSGTVNCILDVDPDSLTDGQRQCWEAVIAEQSASTSAAATWSTWVQASLASRRPAPALRDSSRSHGVDSIGGSASERSRTCGRAARAIWGPRPPPQPDALRSAMAPRGISWCATEHVADSSKQGPVQPGSIVCNRGHRGQFGASRRRGNWPSSPP